MKIPGFIDLQVNGFMGVDFSSPDLTEEQFLFACKELIKKGTVAFLPTVITSSIQIYKRNLGLIGKLMTHQDVKNHLLGIHLEGPFISGEEGAAGAHNSHWVKEPDIRLLDKLAEWSGGNIKLLTLAAELEGAEDLCSHATNLGITVSLGHQLATEEDLAKLVASGARSLTHLGNGLPRMLPRHHNPLWAGLANDDLTAMIITDGHHLPASVIKTIIRTKGVQKIIVVSDASPIAGLPPGKYHTLGNDVVLEASGRLYNPKTEYLVGSSSTMVDCMNVLALLEILKMEEILELGFYNPLRLIGLNPSKLVDNNQPHIGLEENGTFNILFEK